MNIIDSYHFGKIVINGNKFSSDVLILPDRVKDNWWRKIGHQLLVEDIAEIIAENPEVLVVGTGASGLMKVSPEVTQAAQAQGIKLIAETTNKACNTSNRLSHFERVVAALHLTC